MATIKDVAREAGVSVGTVSRYLNGNQLKKDNEDRIIAAIKKLNYKVNIMARGLKTNKTNTVGIIIPDLSDIYSTTIVKNIERKLYDFGYNIIVCDSDNNPNLEKEKASLLVEKQVEGLIIYPCAHDLSYLDSMNTYNIPIVTIDNLVRHYNCDQVLTDNIGATYNAVKWLISQNHRRIGLICGKGNTSNTASERLEGFKRAVKDYGIEYEPVLVQDLGYSKQSGYDGINHLMALTNPPTAVIACNYYTTIGAYRAICDKNIPIPNQLSFIGWDDIGLTEIINPPLTIIAQPMDKVGMKAGELILNRIRGEQTQLNVTRYDTELIIRKSVKKL